MQSEETKTETIREAASKQENDVLLFRVGQLYPINGVWFQVERVDKEGLFLRSVGLTGKGRGKR
jgi:hypothetical protein